MKVNELRIGNLVKIDVGIGTVFSIDAPAYERWNEGMEMPIVVSVNGIYYYCTAEELQGVWITPDHLHSMGFIEETINDRVRYRKGKFCFEEKDRTNINYVHELQNLYYALYKEELKKVKL